MNGKKMMIIGAGPAAQAAAKAMRKLDYSAEITFITREETMPYSPVALPYLINGDLTSEALFEKGEKLVKDLNVNVITGKAVIAVDPAKKEVILQGDEAMAYDKLLIASGASPKGLKVDGLKNEDLLVFRTMADFEKLNTQIKPNSEVLIYGAGLVAVEVAEHLSESGIKVTIVVRSYLLRKYFSQDNIKKLQAQFEKHGVRIIEGKTFLQGKKEGERFNVELNDGTKLSADQVIMAVGVNPNVIGGDLFEQCDGGILVNQYLETSHSDIYAAGDVVAAQDYAGELIGTCPISPEAAQQGYVAGRNMLGADEKYAGWVSCNYLRCFKENLFSIGVLESESDRYDERLEKVDTDKNIKLYFKGDFLVGVEGYNMKSVHPGVFRHLICEQVPIVNERELLLSKPKETAMWMMMKYHDAVKN
ncbi:FAD-dependent oxidoreductase [Fusibacter paucivorans]|uniref:FAD-dependent oxidoreductase n=1 Tax=Fusibacter paucivorans TaxID=76009 RepID=A0ABS5PMR2_9FIRM|nr:NAD(P)/FAD-dependent oxidoreductase [Fusibacter paucivorans]MBS7526182.1 FAD-dependent oxidoreductase [Fusibacter paucivorans]